MEKCFGMRSVLNGPEECQVLKKGNKCEGCNFYKPASEFDAEKVEKECLRYQYAHGGSDDK